MSIITRDNSPAAGSGLPSLLRRVWERIQYPAGPESRDRFRTSRKTRYGW